MSPSSLSSLVSSLSDVRATHSDEAQGFAPPEASGEKDSGPDASTPGLPEEKPPQQLPPAVSDTKRALQVIGCFFLYFNSWGLVNSFGEFQSYYMTTLLRSEPASNISWIGSIMAFFLLFVGSFIGPLLDAGFLTHVLVFGTVMEAFGLFMTSLCDKYWEIILAQGIVAGIGVGCIFLPSVTVIPQYFTTHRSLVLGLVALGSTLGGIVYPITFHYLVSQVGFGWATRVLGFISLATNSMAIAVVRLRNKPPSRRAFFQLYMFKERAYLVFLVGAFVAFIGFYVPIFYIQSYGLEYAHMNAALGFYLLPILMLGSGPGRVIPNFFADKIGALNILIPAVSSCGILALCWMAIKSTAGLIVFAILYGMASGCVVSIAPVAVVTIAPDMKNLGTRMGMALAVLSIALIIGNPVAGAIFDAQHKYIGLQAFSGACTLASSFVLLFARYVRVGAKLMVKV